MRRAWPNLQAVFGGFASYMDFNCTRTASENKSWQNKKHSFQVINYMLLSHSYKNISAGVKAMDPHCSASPSSLFPLLLIQLSSFCSPSTCCLVPSSIPEAFASLRPTPSLLHLCHIFAYLIPLPPLPPVSMNYSAYESDSPSSIINYKMNFCKDCIKLKCWIYL